MNHFRSQSLALLVAVGLSPLALAKGKGIESAPILAQETPPAEPPVIPPPPPAPAVEEPAAAAETTPSPERPVEEKEPDVAEAPESPPRYVEHLGPSSYPGGAYRGLVGGSLWLEPSFHGLQWPVMRHSGVGVSGSLWVDTGYESITRRSNTPDTVRLLQQARGVLRATPTYAINNYFIQGQAEFVGNSAQSKDQSSNAGIVDMDDLWIRFGSWRKWDVKAGRFEGWELYHTGMGLDINTIERRGATQEGLAGNLNQPDYYGLSYLHYRPQAEGMGNVALHVYPSDILRLELLTRVGTVDVQSNSDNTVGTRPMAILDLGMFKFKAGAEYVKVARGQSKIESKTDSDGNPAQVKVASKYSKTQRGVGAAFQVVLPPRIEFGANIGYGQVRETDENGSANDYGSYNTTSVGGFANLRLAEDMLFGAGVNWTTQYDKHRDPNSGKTDYTAHLQAFGALQYHVAKQLLVKAVLAYARADFMPSFSSQNDIWSNTMLSGRVRLMYLY